MGKGLVDLTVSYRRGIDFSTIAAFSDEEVGTETWSPGSFQESLSPDCGLREHTHLEPLGTWLPEDSFTTLEPILDKVIEPEYC